MKATFVLAVFLPLVVLSAAGKLGGKKDYEPNLDTDEVKTAITLLNQYLSETEDGYQTRTGVKVVSATAQVVSGMKYTFTLEVTGAASGKNEQCTLSLWSRSWMPEPENNQLSGDVTCNEI